MGAQDSRKNRGKKRLKTDMVVHEPCPAGMDGETKAHVAYSDPTRRYPLKAEQIECGWVQEYAALIRHCYEHHMFQRDFGDAIRKCSNAFTGWRSSSGASGEDGLEEQGGSNLQPRVFALDCEMVLCNKIGMPEPTVSTLARISLVEVCDSNAEDSQAFRTLLDEFVKIPDGFEVADYLTSVSGVTEESLSNATISHENAVEMLSGIVRSHDILIGHSLSSDYTALRFWHGNFVDSSMLVYVQAAQSIILSLKDIAEIALPDSMKDFQKDGIAHDSIDDAQSAARVVRSLINMKKSGRVDSIPYGVKVIPSRYKLRLTFSSLSGVSNAEDICQFLNRVLANRSFDSEDQYPYEVKKFRRRELRNGNMSASCIVEFTKPRHAKIIFDEIPAASCDCGDFSKRLRSCQDGYPDRSGMHRKLIELSSSGKAARKMRPICEITLYDQFELVHRRLITVDANKIGSIIGKGGKTLTIIQQVSGCRVSMHRQPDPNGKTNESMNTGEILIEADSKQKLIAAENLIKESSRKKFKRG